MARPYDVVFATTVPLREMSAPLIGWFCGSYTKTKPLIGTGVRTTVSTAFCLY